MGDHSIQPRQPQDQDPFVRLEQLGATKQKMNTNSGQHMVLRLDKNEVSFYGSRAVAQLVGVWHALFGERVYVGNVAAEKRLSEEFDEPLEKVYTILLGSAIGGKSGSVIDNIQKVVARINTDSPKRANEESVSKIANLVTERAVLQADLNDLIREFDARKDDQNFKPEESLTKSVALLKFLKANKPLIDKEIFAEYLELASIGGKEALKQIASRLQENPPQNPIDRAKVYRENYAYIALAKEHGLSSDALEQQLLSIQKTLIEPDRKHLTELQGKLKGLKDAYNSNISRSEQESKAAGAGVRDYASLRTAVTTSMRHLASDSFVKGKPDLEKTVQEMNQLIAKGVISPEEAATMRRSLEPYEKEVSATLSNVQVDPNWSTPDRFEAFTHNLLKLPPPSKTKLAEMETGEKFQRNIRQALLDVLGELKSLRNKSGYEELVKNIKNGDLSDASAAFEKFCLANKVDRNTLEQFKQVIIKKAYEKAQLEKPPIDISIFEQEYQSQEEAFRKPGFKLQILIDKSEVMASSDLTAGKSLEKFGVMDDLQKLSKRDATDLFLNSVDNDPIVQLLGMKRNISGNETKEEFISRIQKEVNGENFVGIVAKARAKSENDQRLSRGMKVTSNMAGLIKSHTPAAEQLVRALRVKLYVLDNKQRQEQSEKLTTVRDSLAQARTFLSKGESSVQLSHEKAKNESTVQQLTEKSKSITRLQGHIAPVLKKLEVGDELMNPDDLSSLTAEAARASLAVNAGIKNLK